MRKYKNKIKKFFKQFVRFFIKWISFLLNPHFLVCFLTAWIITNGWSYIFITLGSYFRVNWMIAVGTAYMSFLWTPFTPEKIFTLIIAIYLLKLLFPHDKKTLKVLQEELIKSKKSFQEFKEKHRSNRKNKKQKNYQEDIL